MKEPNCVDALGETSTFENSANLAYFREVMERFGLSESSGLIFEDGDKIHALSLAELMKKTSAASLLYNISGHLAHPEIKPASVAKFIITTIPDSRSSGTRQETATRDFPKTS